MIEKLLSRVGIEVWKDLPGYEGHYRVSNLGNVKILKRNIISKSKTKISLHLNLKYKNFKISQLIAMAFLNHTPCGHILVVDHIDNDNTNNNLYNIQVISHRKNLSKDKKGKSKYTGVSSNYKKWRTQICINGKNKHIGTYKTETEASQAYQNELKKII